MLKNQIVLAPYGTSSKKRTKVRILEYKPDYAKVDEIEEEIRAGESDGIYYTIKLADGGSIPDSLSSQEVEQKLGRRLHWWNDDIIYLSGIKYKKVYLKNEYKRINERYY